MFESLSDEQLLALLDKYQERFIQIAASGESPESTDPGQVFNAGYVFREALSRGLVDEKGKVLK